MSKEFKLLEYTYARCVRRILGIKAAFVSRISNAEIYKRAKVPTFKSQIIQKQLALFGHILRLDNFHPDFLVCFKPHSNFQFAKPPSVFNRKGRPRASWTKQMFDLFSQDFPNFTRHQISMLAASRTRWRATTWRLSSS